MIQKLLNKEVQKFDNIKKELKIIKILLARENLILQHNKLRKLFNSLNNNKTIKQLKKLIKEGD